MDDNRKRAYRWILYQALLDIRPLQWLEPRWYARINPFYWHRYRQAVRRAGAIANWLHNLALYSAIDFEHFDEERFWTDYRSTLGRYSGTCVAHYRAAFERELTIAG